MPVETTKAHDALIIDQFTRQAVPFAEAPVHGDGIATLVQMSGVGAQDDVLDVACGPGLVACGFAAKARHVTGIDLTAKMIEEAQKLAQAQVLSNVAWQVGTATPLPFADASFSVVITRYSLHHFLEPAAVLREMIRVCKPGGTVLVADMSGHAEHMDALNRMEKLRDPSHVRALSLEELEALFIASGLRELTRATYEVPYDLESHLARSFPLPGDEPKILALFEDDLKANTMGMNSRLEKERLQFNYTIGVFCGRK